MAKYPEPRFPVYPTWYAPDTAPHIERTPRPAPLGGATEDATVRDVDSIHAALSSADTEAKAKQAALRLVALRRATSAGIAHAAPLHDPAPLRIAHPRARYGPRAKPAPVSRVRAVHGLALLSLPPRPRARRRPR